MNTGRPHRVGTHFRGLPSSRCHALLGTLFGISVGTIRSREFHSRGVLLEKALHLTRRSVGISGKGVGSNEK